MNVYKGSQYGNYPNPATHPHLFKPKSSMKSIIQDAALFIAEAFSRWGHKSPKYLRVWKIVNWVISMLAFLPLVLSYYKVVTTGYWTDVVLAIVAFSGAYGSAMNGLVVSKPKEVAMPYTDKKQMEDDIKNTA